MILIRLGKILKSSFFIFAYLIEQFPLQKYACLYKIPRVPKCIFITINVLMRSSSILLFITELDSFVYLSYLTKSFCTGLNILSTSQ